MGRRWDGRYPSGICWYPAELAFSQARNQGGTTAITKATEVAMLLSHEATPHDIYLLKTI